MMLDAYQHTSGTCYRNYHGQNDFIYDFTASQTLEGQVSSICHRAVLGRDTMLVHYYWVEYFLYFILHYQVQYSTTGSASTSSLVHTT